MYVWLTQISGLTKETTSKSRLLRSIVILCFILGGAYLLVVRYDWINTAREETVPDSEPLVEVGVILPRDEMRHVDLVLPAGEYQIRGKGRTGTHTFPEETHCRISIGNHRAELLFSDAPSVGSYVGTPVSILPANDPTGGPGGGILVRDIVTGRSFHWRKRIDQHLPGSLHFYLERGQNYLTVVNELPAETYLAGVITSEMSSACPVEFLECQAVVARSWLLNLQSHKGKHPDHPYTACNDDHCQRYQGSDGATDEAVRAVNRTRGLIIRNDDGTIGNAMYSKSCGGSTSDPSHIWRNPIKGCQVALDAPDRFKAHAYFPVNEENAFQWLTEDWWKTSEIFCSPNVVSEEDLLQYLGRVDHPGPYFRWEVSYTGERLAGLLRRHEDFTNLDRVLALEPAGRGPSGRLWAVAVRYESRNGKTHRRLVEGQNNIREVLHSSFLYSSAFVVDHVPPTDSTGERFILHGGGWGHGVGLCQIGALGMALKGYDLEQIINHYYSGVTLHQQYPWAETQRPGRLG